jgi:DNA-binding HxlR family transcriptional regulator
VDRETKEKEKDRVVVLPKNSQKEGIMDKSAADLTVELDEKDREISEARRVLEEVHQAILDLRFKRIELERVVSKAKYNYDKLKIERTLISSAFWQAKNSGL